MGRLNSIDPLTELQDSWNPYHYNYNNPIAFVDPTGLMPADLSDPDDDWKPSFVGETKDEDNPWVGDFGKDFGFAGEAGNGGGNGPSSSNLNFNSFNREIFSKTGDDSQIGPHYPVYNRSNTGTSFVDVLSWSFAGLGTYTGAKELSLFDNGKWWNGGNGMWRGGNGKWYSTNWGGNGGKIGTRTMVLGKTAYMQAIGKGAFFIGATISVGQFIMNPTFKQGIQSGTDLGMGAWGVWGGPVGFGASTVYFGDQFLKSVSPSYKKFRDDSDAIGRKYPERYFHGGIYVCFEEGTLVDTEMGLIEIQELNVGDLVYSFNFDTDSIELRPITKFYTREVREIYEVITSDKHINVTSEHPFYVIGKEWVKARDLAPNDQLRSVIGKCPVVISNSRKVDKTVTVYNIEVSSNHNYFVSKSKVMVHNKNMGDAPKAQLNPSKTKGHD